MSRQLKIAMHQLNYITGDFEGNFRKTAASIRSSLGADIHVLQECAVTNYPSDDYFLDAGYQLKVLEYCEKYRALSQELGVTVVVGTPLGGKSNSNRMGNGLVVYQRGREVFRQLKTHMPNYDIFDDVRWFESRLEQTGPDRDLGVLKLELEGGPVTLGFAICEDIWFDDVTREVAALGAEVIISINFSPYAIAKGNFRREVFRKRVAETAIPLAYANGVGGNDETVNDGCSATLDPDGVMYEMEPGKDGVEIVTLADTGRGFRNTVEKKPLVLNDQQERYLMAGLGLRDFIRNNGFEDVVLGLSGGADSTFVANIAADVFGAEHMLAIMMPSPHTSEGSNTRAARLAAGIGGGFRSEVWDITAEYETSKANFERVRGREMGKLANQNLQAQIRGNILSTISNDHGRLAILGTSNKSEILCGYGTLYGDMRGAFNVCKDLYKSIDIYPLLAMRKDLAVNPDPVFERLWEQTFGRRLAEYTPDAVKAQQDVIDELPSAELEPGQLDTDSLPPYPRLDAVLWQIEDAKVSQTDEQIAAITGETVEFVAMIRAKRKSPEFKRFQSAPGVKIHRKSPTTKDRRFPMTSRFA